MKTKIEHYYVETPTIELAVCTIYELLRMNCYLDNRYGVEYQNFVYFDSNTSLVPIYNEVMNFQKRYGRTIDSVGVVTARHSKRVCSSTPVNPYKKARIAFNTENALESKELAFNELPNLIDIDFTCSPKVFELASNVMACVKDGKVYINGELCSESELKNFVEEIA